MHINEQEKVKLMAAGLTEYEAYMILAMRLIPNESESSLQRRIAIANEYAYFSQYGEDPSLVLDSGELNEVALGFMEEQESILKDVESCYKELSGLLSELRTLRLKGYPTPMNEDDFEERKKAVIKMFNFPVDKSEV